MTAGPSAVGLRISIDPSELKALGKQMHLDAEQIRLAYARALRRTANTIRSGSLKGLKARLGLRSTKRLRRRLKAKQMKANGGVAAWEVWFGQNDWPVADFGKGPAENESGVAVGDISLPGAFLVHSGGSTRVLRRVGRARLPVESVGVPVKAAMDEFIESEVFDRVEEVFFRYFEHEVRARALFGVGQ